ncbi:MAG: type II toxin-antitoxin system RelE/ParE family toxin [Deltaproteobacteria bacterium]|nr:MAG: type II toxin-antitoxin system RelE/ParE family toxin [Deltaproteobacteria bacterium]
MYRIEFAKKAAKFYQKTDTATAQRLNRVLERLTEDPFNLPNIKHLKGELAGSYRIRMGDIRIIYSVDQAARIVYIEVIGYRGDVYKA